MQWLISNVWALTLILCLVVTVALIAYDVWVIARGGVKASISVVILSACRRYPPILFALAYLMGHLTWPQHVTNAPVDCVSCVIECGVKR